MKDENLYEETRVTTEPPQNEQPGEDQSKILTALPESTDARQRLEGSGEPDVEQLAVETHENNYKDICRECVLRDVVGCNNCGIYHYVAKRATFEIKVTRR